LIAGSERDPHVAVVAAELRKRAAKVLIGSVTELGLMGLTWRVSTGTVLRVGGELVHAAGAGVWWRRPAGCLPSDLTVEDQALLIDETAVLVPAALEAASVRWVDPPWSMDRARLKTVQLVAASDLGIRVPETVITSDPNEAEAFALQVGPVVAKAASSGVGIAPYVEVVPVSVLSLVAACPTLLQARVRASQDIRVVTVGCRSWVWCRRRESDGPTDWRAADPQGAGFALLEGSDADGVVASAMLIAARLGLSMSVQDWVVDEDGPVFLEVNPQGQWLFLAGSAECVAPALADHLIGDGI
jgi:hypothetical protein